MPAVSEEELQQLRERNESLREQIQNASFQSAQNELDRQREYEAIQLRTENVRLEAELESAMRRADPEASEASSENILASAMERLKAAEAQAEQPAGVPVDTNAENQPEGTTGATVAVETNETAKPVNQTSAVQTPVVNVVPNQGASSNGGNK